MRKNNILENLPESHQEQLRDWLDTMTYREAQKRLSKPPPGRLPGTAREPRLCQISMNSNFSDFSIFSVFSFTKTQIPPDFSVFSDFSDEKSLEPGYSVCARESTNPIRLGFDRSLTLPSFEQYEARLVRFDRKTHQKHNPLEMPNPLSLKDETH